jgi:uncharacterized membrane protein
MIRKGLLMSIAPLAVMLALGLWAWQGSAPGEQFPVHWGISGQPDRYAGAAEAFFVMPGIALGLTLLMAVVPMLDPRGDNIRRSAPFYLTVWMAVLVLMAVIQTAMVLMARGILTSETMTPRIVGSGVALLLLVMGNMLGKSRPNWFAGVRTPWTLSSDITWEKTHRLAGRLFVLVGLVGVVAAWAADPSVTMPILVLGALGTGVVAVIYSWMVWRTAPDRRRGPQAVD